MARVSTSPPAPMLHEVLGPRHERWSSARAVLELRIAEPNVVLARGEGHGSMEHAELIIEWRERALDHLSRIVLFDDLEKMESYDPGCRPRLTQWIARHRQRIEALHILVHSRLASMGVTVANLALGGFLRAHQDRESFERELAKALRH